MLLSSAEFLAGSDKEKIHLAIFSGALGGVGVLSCEGTLIKIGRRPSCCCLRLVDTASEGWGRSHRVLEL